MPPEVFKPHRKPFRRSKTKKSLKALHKEYKRAIDAHLKSTGIPFGNDFMHVRIINPDNLAPHEDGYGAHVDAGTTIKPLSESTAMQHLRTAQSREGILSQQNRVLLPGGSPEKLLDAHHKTLDAFLEDENAEAFLREHPYVTIDFRNPGNYHHHQVGYTDRPSSGVSIIGTDEPREGSYSSKALLEYKATK